MNATFYFALLGLVCLFIFCNQGRRASRLPLAITFRAVGAATLVLQSISSSDDATRRTRSITIDNF